MKVIIKLFVFACIFKNISLILIMKYKFIYIDVIFLYVFFNVV